MNTAFFPYSTLRRGNSLMGWLPHSLVVFMDLFLIYLWSWSTVSVFSFICVGCLQLAKQEELFSPLKCGPAWVPFTLLFSCLFLVVHTFHTLHPPHRHCADRSNIVPVKEVSYKFWNFPISCNGNLVHLDSHSPFPLPWVTLPLLFVSLTGWRFGYILLGRYPSEPDLLPVTWGLVG